MYNKLKLIKMLLGTILTALVIISLMKSCSYAYTFEDFIYYCGIVANDSNAPTNFRNKAQQIIDNQQGFRTNLGSSTYTNWVVDVNSGYLKFQVHNGTLTLASNQQNNMIKFSNATFREYYKSGNSFDNGNNSGISYLAYNTYFGLLDLNQDYTFPNEAWFNNKYIPPVTGWIIGIEHPNNPNDPLPLLIGQAQTIGQIDPLTVNFKLYSENDNLIEYNYQIEIEEGIEENDYIYSIFLLSDTGLINGNYYYLQMYNNNNLLATSEQFKIQWGVPPPTDSTITNQSGDVSIIDYSPITNRIDNLTNIIQSGDLKVEEAIIKLESGEQQRQSFWENAYNTMFVPSGDYIEQKIEELKEDLQLSGDYSGELLILENIKNNSGDFIISWNAVSTHFSTKGVQNENQLIIPSGDINFSKLERENEELQESMKWVRILLGFSLTVLIIKQWWTLVLKTLGISTDVYEQHREEEERLKVAQEHAREKEKRTIARQLFNANQIRLREYEKMAKQKGWRK